MTDKAYDRAAGNIPMFGKLLLGIPEEIKLRTYDIRLKAGQPVTLCGRDGVRFLRSDGAVSNRRGEPLLTCSEGEMRDVFLSLCGHSVFSHENEIRKGFVNVGRAYRAGICGTAVTEDGAVKNVKDITSLVFRIPREIHGCADVLFQRGVDFSGGVLIVGEPSSGKTTLLRDLVQALSEGRHGTCRRLSVLDERGELGGMFSLGPCADVLSGYPKKQGFDTAVRMLSPELIVCDELGDADLEEVKKSSFSGVSMIASVHATAESFWNRPLCRDLAASGAFRTVVFLKGRDAPARVKTIETLGGKADG